MSAQSRTLVNGFPFFASVGRQIAASSVFAQICRRDKPLEPTRLFQRDFAPARAAALLTFTDARDRAVRAAESNESQPV